MTIKNVSCLPAILSNLARTSAILLTIGFNTTALAQSYDWDTNDYGSYSTYDSAAGNSYRVTRNPGSTDVYGWSNSGSTWHGTYNSNGVSSGVNKDGDYWYSDSRTGYYTNTNGRTCYGLGASRTCYR